ncbi:MAG: hypothetical protein AAFR61_01830 [Bacteroidota bacterium]
MRTNSLNNLWMGLLILGLTVMACGEQGSSTADAEAAPVKESSVTVKATGDVMTEIAYSPSTLVSEPGSVIKVTFVNESAVAGMYHNMILVAMGKEKEVIAACMAAGPDKEFVADMPEVLAASKLLNIGETTEFEIKVPDAPGNYPIICSYPGHYPIMKAELQVIAN